jgi:predicted alpha/beta-hydrolase family hydrolase
VSLIIGSLLRSGKRGDAREAFPSSLSTKIQFHWLCPDGDHSFKPRKIFGRSQEGNWSDTVRTVAEFAKHLTT